jgi:hypothetical protein
VRQSTFGLLDSHTGWTGWEAAAHGPADAVTIPDAHLLFSGDFKRAGTDLILSDETQRFVVHDYFRGEHHPTLLSPDGARLAADVVDALTGHGAYAQAVATPNAVVAVGRVAKVEGSATIVRNGVAITVNTGDAVLKGDVLQTGAGVLGVTFADGSTLSLTANSRLMVDDFVYDSNGSANSEVLNLVQGSLSFISGEVSHSGGNMKITTPVATMGIRGTVGGITQASDGTVSFFVVESATGAVITDGAGHVIAQVVANGPLIQVRATGPLDVVAAEIDKSPQELAAELAVLQQIIGTQAVGQQIIQHFQDLQNNQGPHSNGTDHTQIQIDIPKSAFTDAGTGGGGGGTQSAGNTATVTTTTTDQGGHTTTTHDDVPFQSDPTDNSPKPFYYTGGGDPDPTNPTNPSNWDPNAAPTSNDDLVFGQDQSHNPVADKNVSYNDALAAHSLSMFDGAHLAADDITVAGDIALFGDGSRSTEIVGDFTIHDLGGSIFLKATTSDAVIRSTDDLYIGKIAGSLTVAADSQCGSVETGILACGPRLRIGNIGESFLLSATASNYGSAVAKIAAGDIMIGNIGLDFTVTGGADSCSATFAEISATCGDVNIGNVGRDFLNQGLIDADNGVLSIGTVGHSFINDGVMRAYEFHIAPGGNVLNNNGQIIIDSGVGGDNDTSTIGVDVNNNGVINVTDTLLTLDGHAQNLDCGVILAGHGSEIDFNGGVSNSALIKASYGGEIDFDTTVHNTDYGLILAADCGSAIIFDCGTVDNCATIKATDGGGIAFNGSVVNADLIEASHHGEIDFNAGIDNFGTVEAASSGSIHFGDGSIDNCGIIEANSGGVIVFSHWVGGTGTLAMDGGTVELTSGTCNTIDFSGTCGGNLVLDCATAGLGQIQGFGPDDSIDLAHLTGVSIVGYTADSCTTGTLELTSCTTGNFCLSFTGDCTNYTADNFALSPDGNCGTQISERPAIDVLGQHVNTDPCTNVTTVTDFKIVEPFDADEQLTITAVATHDATLAFGNTCADGTISETATLDEINAVLHNGIVYTPGACTPEIDSIAVRIASDHGSENMNLMFKALQTPGGVTLTATSGNDVMYGTESGDNFVFDNSHSGHDVIANFDTAADDLQFDHTLFAPNETVAQILQSAASDSGNNAVISTANGATITFDHVTVAQLQSIDQNHVVIN